MVLPSVLANDTNSGGYPLFISIVSYPEHGYLEIDFNNTPENTSDDTFIYTPDPDYNGTDSFSYMLTDIWGQTSVATVSLTITAVDDEPYVDSEIFHTGYKNATATVDILSHVEDVDDTSFTLAIPSNASHGTASVVGNVIEYVPGPISSASIASPTRSTTATSQKRGRVSLI